jgi:hypothetical protein
MLGYERVFCYWTYLVAYGLASLRSLRCLYIVDAVGSLSKDEGVSFGLGTAPQGVWTYRGLASVMVAARARRKALKCIFETWLWWLVEFDVWM